MKDIEQQMFIKKGLVVKHSCTGGDWEGKFVGISEKKMYKCVP